MHVSIILIRSVIYMPHNEISGRGIDSIDDSWPDIVRFFASKVKRIRKRYDSWDFPTSAEHLCVHRTGSSGRDMRL